MIIIDFVTNSGYPTVFHHGPAKKTYVIHFHFVEKSRRVEMFECSFVDFDFSKPLFFVVDMRFLTGLGSMNIMLILADSESFFR